jgi:hypothetical protein
LAYLGSLVGFTREVDKSTLNRYDYVRIRLAARDVAKVPGVAERPIVPYLYDFFFERKVVDEQAPEKASVQVQVNEAGKDNPTSVKQSNVIDSSSSSQTLQMESMPSMQMIE